MALFGRAINELKQVPKDDKATTYDDFEAPEKATKDTTSEEPITPEDDGDYNLEDDEEIPIEDEDPEVTEDEPVDDEANDGNYDLDDGDGEEPIEDEDPEATEDEPVEDEPVEGGDTELKDKENELFSSMTEIQKSLKDKELVQNYVGLYNIVDSLNDKLERVPKTDETLKVLEFTSRKSEEVRALLQKYISETYGTKTYLENLTNYYQFISIIKKIERGLAVIKEKNNDENE